MNTSPEKFIDFIITQKCSYKCPYCSQSKAQTCKYNEADLETIDAFYKFLDILEKDFEITITGGEAILHPNFFEIIEQVKKRGFKINLITNLSFKIETYIKIFEILGDSLNIFDISFHLNQIQDFNKTLEKAELFIKEKLKSTKTTFFIPLYLIDKKSEQKIDKLIKLAKKHNISYSFQKIRFLDKYKKTQNEKYVSHHKKEQAFGYYCYTGSKSAVIYENGNAYGCYSSRFSKSNYLGNIKDENFKLNQFACVCTSKNCTCPKPKAYNQITNKKNYQIAIKVAFLNLINLPKAIIQNQEIIKTKIRQKLDI